jgi:protein gp37
MSDLFWDQIPESYRDQIVDVIEATPQHEYQVLTKRAEEMLRYSRRRKLPPNFWAGVSIEDQARAFRADVLRQVDTEIRFVSAEPLLGPLVLDWSGIHWCISGGESGRHLLDPKLCAKRALVDRAGQGRWTVREDRMPWVRSLRDQCLSAGVKFFHKQWGGLSPKSAGRLLDGRTWDEFPRLPGDKQAITNPHLRK